VCEEKTKEDLLSSYKVEDSGKARREQLVKLVGFKVVGGRLVEGVESGGGREVNKIRKLERQWWRVCAELDPGRPAALKERAIGDRRKSRDGDREEGS
jgi:hypothetical protein